MSHQLKIVVLFAALNFLLLLLASGQLLTHFGPPDAAAIKPAVTSVQSQCLALVGNSFLPCNEVEPRLYPHEWLALRRSI